MSRAAKIALLLALVPGAAAAQAPRWPRWFAGGVSATTVRVVHSGPTGVPLTGLALAGDVRLGGRIAFEGSYAQGSLKPDTGNGLDRDLVDARALVVARATDWLIVKAGAHIVGFVTPTVTERWTRFEARVRGDRILIPDHVNVHLEGWMALGTSTNLGDGSGSGRGAEAGMTLRLGRSPMAARLTYTVDRAELESTRVTLEYVSLSLRLRY
jgi:hypothetical protein